MTDDISDQPDPIPTGGKPVWDMVIEDMKARDAVGRKRYGTPLQTGNGRKMLVDAYQEVLDLAAYLRGEIEERDKLQRFKDYVHSRLDAAGVAVDPESSHKAEGCRIGGRLDELIGERDKLRIEIARLEAALGEKK